jgi:hypothetical protein
MDKFWQWLYHIAEHFFNLKKYHPAELTMFFAGFTLWVFAYYYIIKDIRKYKFCEMPMLVATGNIAWEFTWSFLFFGDLGPFFTWGARVWFTMDLFINYNSLKYGLKDVSNPDLRKHYRFWYVFSLIAWFCVVYFMGWVDRDTHRFGIQSALLINVVMSALYIYQLLNYPGFRGKGLNYKVAWYKMFGTGFITLGSTLVWWDKNNQLFMTFGILSFLLDAIYIYLFRYYKNPALESLTLDEYQKSKMPV